MNHDELDREARELAALFALGALPDDEHALAAERVARDPAFAREVAEQRRVIGEATLDVETQEEPPPGLWSRVIERLDAPESPPIVPLNGHASRARPGGSAHADDADHANRPWLAWGAAARPDGARPDSVHVVRGGGEFEETGYPGVRVRRLSVDPARGEVTMLVRMEAGSSYPPHRHGDFEECFVLEGTLVVEGEADLDAGDYQSMEAGTVHPTQRTETGCLLLIRSGVRDEMI